MKIDFKGALGTIAPFIAQAVGSSIPIFGPMAAGMIGSALGVKDVEPTAAGVSAAIEKAGVVDPEVLAKLQQVEQDFKLKLATLDIDSVEKLASLEVQDRENARAREISIKDKLPAALAVTVTIFLFTLTFVIRSYGVPESAHDTIIQLIEAIKVAWISIISYYFGSSLGSTNKTAILGATVNSK